MGPADSFSEKEIMGLGFLGSSSSSSAPSNLSPLAPPFTVDRYNHNINSNPVSHFDDPSHGLPFTSSWLYSHPTTARQDFLADSIRTATVPCANDDGYAAPEPISSPTTHNWFGENTNVNASGTHWSAVNTSPGTATDVFSYNVSEAKPFYPLYAWPVSNSDIPSEALTNPSYVSDLVVDDGPSRVDYAPSLSVLEHNSRWENIWSELPGGKHGKGMEFDLSFLLEDSNIAGTPASRRDINQGVHGTDTLSKHKGDSVMFPGTCADVFRRENYIGPPISGVSDGKSSTTKDHCLVPKEYSEATAFKAFPTFSESRQLVPSLEPSAEHWNIQKSYGLPEKRYHMFDCPDHCILPSIKKSSHSPVITPLGPVTKQNSSTFPTSSGSRTNSLEVAGLLFQPVTNFSAQDTDPTKCVEISDSASFDSSKVVCRTHKYRLKEKELHPSLGFDDEGSFLVPNQPSFQRGRINETFVVPSSTREEMSNKLSTNDPVYFEFKAGSNFQAPDANSLTFKSSVISASTFSEHSGCHNAAEDSPCWKGSPTYHLSPIRSPEVESAQYPTKKLQTNNGINLQGSQTDHSSKPTSAELRENSNSSERTSKEHKPGGGVDVIGYAKARRAQSSSDITRPRMGFGFLNKSANDMHSETSQVKLPNLAEDVLLFDRKAQLPVGVEDHRTCAVRNSSLSYVEDDGNLATAGERNVNILVKTLHNLSELLLFHCSDDGCSLKEQDHKALDHVAANLDVCMSRKLQQAVPTKKCMSPHHGSPSMFQEVKNGTAGVSHGHAGSHYRPRNHDTFGRSSEALQGCASPREDGDLPKDQNMIQAIKKILDENLKCEEEMPSQTLLYKNLWLEAEAELCVGNYRARFERMKKELERCKLDEGTVSDVSAMNKTSSSEPYPDLKISPILTPEADDRTISYVQNPSSLSLDSHIDDVEAYYNILKCYGESKNIERQEICDAEVSSMGSQTSRGNVEPHLQRHCDDSLGDQMMWNQFASSNNIIEPSIMALLDIVKRRGEQNAVGKASSVSVAVQNEAEKGNTVYDDETLETILSGDDGMQQSESDWENVFEDEISWQPNGHI